METLLLWKIVANLCSAGQDFLLAWPLWGHTAPAPVASLLTHPSLLRLFLMTKSHIPWTSCRTTTRLCHRTQGPIQTPQLLSLYFSQAAHFQWSQHFFDNILLPW